MLPQALLFLLAPLVVAEASPDTPSDIVVNFDRSLEGLISVEQREVEVVDNVGIPSEFSTPKKGLDAVDANSLLDSRAVLDTLLNKRQTSCSPGYGYCASFGRCCPSSSKCCPYGYCIQPNDTCCPKGPCDGDQGCCGANNCYPKTGECCSDGSFCYAGNHCYISTSRGRLCCTDSKCTAAVDRYGTTTYASTSTSTTRLTTTRAQYYSWTYTYWYWYYYWTVSVQIDASIVTSTRRTTTTIFSVQTTDASAASSYFSELSRTVTVPTPAEATSLESLAGSTSFGSAATRSSTSSRARSTAADSTDDDTSTDSSSTSSRSSSTTAAGTTSVVQGSPGGSSGAARLWSGMNASVMGFLSFGLGVGILAVML
ncbi:unnamed protein product [Clonostachys rhizophaga]|uniref:Carbohydrate-binding module family 18 protein n=1 Tax=Clonostachys rhizophaga TaxID=160324 RepID=A0A9N9YKD7_9HYPO|nr:unnamed protein product [Clonostachys rhizophaga]